MTIKEIVEGLEIYTVGRPLQHRAFITVEELQKFIDAIKVLDQESILDKIRAEIDRQEKWLMDAGYNAYNIDIAFDAIKSVVESEDKA